VRNVGCGGAGRQIGAAGRSARRRREISRRGAIGCHDLSRILNANHSAAEWRNVVNMMVAAGARLSPAEKDAVARYLIESFPERARPRPVVIAGPVQVSFREWEVPTPGARPHDPLATPDGALWYTGQMANILGRLDPSTGAIKEYPLKTPASGPHGLVDDQAGHIWFTANFAGYIGELDPKSGEVKEYQLPDAARDPHTLLFDNDGVLWFTVQNANMLGRLDPKSGAIKLATMTTPSARPYGMALSADGRSVFFDLFGSNKIARVDRASMAITEYPLPDGSSRPRRIAVSGDGFVWYSDYSRGRLGRRPADRQGDRISLSGRPAIAALCHRRAQRRCLVCRDRRAAERAGALRSGDGEVSDLDHSLGRRGGAQHDADARRQSCVGLQRRQRRRARRDQEPGRDVALKSRSVFQSRRSRREGLHPLCREVRPR
jgi:virginiamycin B lyase